jgi:DNA replicative helicase MCM subunit Mcm2 (Cdc46/Mcm family)
MDTNKAAYWIALAVLALGLNSEYHQGNLVVLHRVADRAGDTLCRLSTRGEHLLALAKFSLQQKVRENDVEVATNGVESARAQAQLMREQAHAQAESMREQARAQGEAIREQVRAQVEELRAQSTMRRAMDQQVRVRGRYLNLVSSGNHGMTVVCPKTGTRVVVSDDSDLSDDAKVEVDDSF